MPSPCVRGINLNDGWVESPEFVEAVGNGARGGGVVIIMRGRGRMTTDPRILAMLGRSTPGFHLL